MKRTLPLALAVSLLAGCASPPAPPLDDPNPRLQPRESRYTLEKLSPLASADAAALDSLEGTHYDLNGRTVDLAEARFALEVAEFEPGAEEQLKNVVYADYVTAMNAAAEAGVSNTLPSVNVVDGVCKQVNDDVYARLELLVEKTRKSDLRRRLLLAFQQDFAGKTADPHRRDLVVRTAAALKLAGEPPELLGAFKTEVDQAIRGLEADPLRGKPIGFYTQDEALTRIFKADRMLRTQVSLSRDGNPDDEGLREAAIAASVLTADADLADLYRQVASFYQRMTNPFSAYSPIAIAEHVPAGESLESLISSVKARRALYDGLKSDTALGLAFSLLPPSRSVESTLAAEDAEAQSDLMGTLIKRVREGAVSLAPQVDSGFYQYQQHALEALLTPEKNPEGQKIAFGKSYLARLEESFKTGLTKARETHAKQLDTPTLVTAVHVPVKPKLFIEPIATVYLRYAKMYDFLEQQVLPLFTDAELAEAEPLPQGSPLGLKEEVAAAKRLMAGLYVIAAAELGLASPEEPPLAAGKKDQAIAEAKAWLTDLSQDERLGADTRVAVPVAVSEPEPGKRVIRFWGTAGVGFTKVSVSYTAGLEGEEPADYFVTSDRFVTFTRPYELGVLSREEYRRILDTSSDWETAIARLEGR